jgi:hypothetical protein
VPGIRAANSYEKVIFRSEMKGDVSFALTPVLTADQDIHEPCHAFAVQAKVACSTYLHILWYILLSVDDHISLSLESAYVGLRETISRLLVGGEFCYRRRRFSFLETGGKLVVGCVQMHVDNLPAKRLT